MSKPESRMMPRDIASNLRRAETLVRKGEWSAADDCFAAAIQQDPSPASRIAFASSLAGRERYHDALCQMTSALDQASSEGNREALSVIYHNLAAIYRELGDFDLAQRFQHRAILQLDDCGSEELLGLANDAWLSNRRKLAATLADSSAELGELDETSIEAEATVAVISGLNDGNSRDGIRTLLRAYRTHRSMSEYRLMGIDLLNLSILFGQVGRVRGEIDLVQHAIRCFEKVSAGVSITRARQVLATLQRAQSLRDFDPSRN